MGSVTVRGAVAITATPSAIARAAKTSFETSVIGAGELSPARRVGVHAGCRRGGGSDMLLGANRAVMAVLRVKSDVRMWSSNRGPS
jgi:hypothetical protein